MLFIDLCSPKRLRVNGTARIEPPEFVDAAFPEAQFVVVVDIREVFPNCPRYIHKFALVERSKFVPHEGVVDAGARLETNGLGARRAASQRSCRRSRECHEASQSEQGLVLAWAIGAAMLLVAGGVGVLLAARRGARSPSRRRRAATPVVRRPRRRRPPSSTRRRRRSARCRCRRSTRAMPMCSADLTELFGQDAVMQHPRARAHRAQHRRHDRQRAARSRWR